MTKEFIAIIEDMAKEYELLAKYNGGKDYLRWNALNVILEEQKECSTNSDVKEVTITMLKCDSDRYFCKGQRLAFDYPWEIYIVNGDLFVPYYRVYINNKFMSIYSTAEQCYEFLKGLTKEQAHVAGI